MRRAAEVLPIPKSGRVYSDAELSTTCPDCDTRQVLSDMTTKEDSDVTGYFCKSCDSLCVAVHTFRDDPPQENAGYRIGDWILSTKADLFLKVDSGNAVQFDATPAFFEYV